MTYSPNKTSLESPKLLTLKAACAQRETLYRQQKTLVLTNGCFDLLHTGHLYSLNQAAAQGDILWVALNGDAGVRQLKGPSRPILSEEERAYALACLSCVQGIILFQTPDLHREILMLKPDIYVKAGDYDKDRLNPKERRALEENQVDIRFMPFLHGYSTTALIDRIQGINGP